MHARWMLVVGMLVGCGGDDGGGSDFCPVSIEGDPTVAITAQTLSFDLPLIAVPKKLVFDQEAVPANVLEWSWGVEIDTESNGTYDWEVALKYFRRDGVAEHIVDDPTTQAQADLWQISGATGSIAGDATVTVNAKHMQILVETREAAGLSAVTMDGSTFRFATHYQYGPGSNYCEDAVVVD